jgi:hypothetical protein
MSVNKWTNGGTLSYCYQIFNLSTVGYGSITFSAKMVAGNNNAPRDFKIQYSVNDGASWNDVGSPISMSTSWQTVASNLSLPNASNQPDLDIRILQTSDLDINNSSIGTGNNAWIGIDDIIISGTPQGPVLSVTPTNLTYGSVCIGTSTSPASFNISGSNLTTADVSVEPLTGYTFSTTSGGTYFSSLNLTHAAGSYSQTIYAKFSPIAPSDYNGNVVVSGGGASSVNLAVSGAGLNTPPTISSPTNTSVTSNSAILGGNVTSIGCSNVVERGIYYST